MKDRASDVFKETRVGRKKDAWNMQPNRAGRCVGAKTICSAPLHNFTARDEFIGVIYWRSSDLEMERATAILEAPTKAR